MFLLPLTFGAEVVGDENVPLYRSTVDALLVAEELDDDPAGVEPPGAPPAPLVPLLLLHAVLAAATRHTAATPLMVVASLTRIAASGVLKLVVGKSKTHCPEIVKQRGSVPPGTQRDRCLAASEV
jgi:hypothetical protein